MFARQMKLDYFNTYLFGGAAIGALSAYELLKESKDIDARFFCMQNKGIRETDDFIARDPYHLQKNLWKKAEASLAARLYYFKLSRVLAGRPDYLEQFSPSRQFFSTPYELFSSELPDIIHLNWISEWIDYPSFFASIPDHIPIVWTLHDMNPFTGGCHYSWECLGYKDQCLNCFQLNPGRAALFAAKNQDVKAESIRNKKIHVVADSKWIEEEARSSRIFENALSFRTIYYGLDARIFKRSNDNYLREKYNIPPEAFIILSGAASVQNKRKGIDHLLAGAEKLLSKGNEFKIILFGEATKEISEKYPDVIFLGSVKRGEEMARIYSSADLFVITSLYEAFGLTAIESMACGTPVVGFRTGGIPETVIPGISGMLAEPGDSDSLVSSIMWMRDHPKERMEIGEKAIKLVHEQFTLERQAEAYLELYREIRS